MNSTTSNHSMSKTVKKPEKALNESHLLNHLSHKLVFSDIFISVLKTH